MYVIFLIGVRLDPMLVARQERHHHRALGLRPPAAHDLRGQLRFRHGRGARGDAAVHVPVRPGDVPLQHVFDVMSPILSELNLMLRLERQGLGIDPRQ
jgi:hypothetical protein